MSGALASGEPLKKPLQKDGTKMPSLLEEAMNLEFQGGQPIIRDPEARRAYGQRSMQLAQAAAGEQYIKAQESAKQQQLLQMLKVAGGLEPELQEALLNRLGIRGKTPVLGKTGQAMALARQKYALEAPHREAQLGLRLEEMEGRREGRTAQQQLQQQMIDMRREANLGQKVQYLKLMQSVLADPNADVNLKRHASQILMQGLMELTSSGTPQAAVQPGDVEGRRRQVGGQQPAAAGKPRYTVRRLQ